MAKEGSMETSPVDSPASSKYGNATNHHEEHGGLELNAQETDLVIQKMEISVQMPREDCREKDPTAQQPIVSVDTDDMVVERKKHNISKFQKLDVSFSSVDNNEGNTPKIKEARHESENPCEVQNTHFPPSSSEAFTLKNEDDGIKNEGPSGSKMEISELSEKHKSETNVSEHNGSVTDFPSLDTSVDESEVVDEKEVKGHDAKKQNEGISSQLVSEKDLVAEKTEEMIFDGTKMHGGQHNKSVSCRSLESYTGDQRSLFPETAVAITNFMRVKSAVAVSSLLCHLSIKGYDDEDTYDEGIEYISIADRKEVSSSTKDDKFQGIPSKNDERYGLNPLSFIGISRDSYPNGKAEQMGDTNKLVEPIPMKGRIILYTRLGCRDCKDARLFLHQRRLRYVEINIDVYPGRNCELEKFSGSQAVPKVFFNEVVIGGLSELKELDESGKLKEKIEYVISEAPPFDAPLPPLSGEDDVSNSGSIDELALIVRNMKKHIVVKDRFYKMRRFVKTFMGSEAVNFLSEDQHLEREEAIQFGQKLVQKLFFQHVLEENVFEDGNDLYRFLDDDPFISQCQNIPRGIIELKPKPIADISSMLRLMCYAIFEAYTSKDGTHVDYRSIHGSEEFARYLRIVEELQQVDLHGMHREEKLAFFINLYNMMAIHAILVWGHPTGVLERRKLFGEFKYVIGGCTYSLSDIQNGILRGNQRTPYTFSKPFGGKDKRSLVALSYPEPLVHFALVCGTRSGPALRCYSSGDIDKELMEAAHKFLRSGGITVDLNAKIASVNKILKWYSADFGNNESEVLKHVANYLEAQESQTLLELLDETQLSVVYQPYDWGLNN